MTTTKTVSTRVDENIYKSLIDYSNEVGQTVSQVLHENLIGLLDCIRERKEYDLQMKSEHSVATEDKDPTFSQDSKIEKELKSIDYKKLQEKILSEVTQPAKEYFQYLNQEIKAIGTSMDRKLNEDRLKKGMACFKNDSHFY